MEPLRVLTSLLALYLFQPTVCTEPAEIQELGVSDVKMGTLLIRGSVKCRKFQGVCLLRPMEGLAKFVTFLTVILLRKTIFLARNRSNFCLLYTSPSPRD